jgi:hypothetical protein
MLFISPFLLPTFRVHHFSSAFLSALTSRFPAFFKFLKRKLEIHPKYFRDGRVAPTDRITLNQDDSTEFTRDFALLHCSSIMQVS